MGNSTLIWTMVITDSLIALAYLAISANLYDLVRKIRLPFSTMFVAFGTFILACGATHALEVYTIWVPNYWLAAGVKVVTAIASVATALFMVPARKQVEQTLADARAVHSDLSSRVESRTEELQEAIKARDQFLSIASHELKTPLTSLKLQLELLHKRIAKGVNETSTEKFSQSLRLSSLQVDRLTVLVEDLLDVSRIQAGKLSIHSEIVNLTEVVQSAIEQFSETAVKSGCQIELKIENEIQGFWDYSRIEQVLANLISNAIKYAPGSKIEIAVRNAAPWAEISVKDNGPGIEPHRQARIFERFERATSSRSISGLGLGLFIVRELVNAHKGLIEVKSTPGQGSQFIVRLPLPQNAEATSSSQG